MNNNTFRIYKRAFELFLELSGKKLNKIIKMDPKELTKLIDVTFEKSGINPRTKRCYTFGVRKLLHEEYGIELNKTYITEKVSADIPKKTNKEIITRFEMQKLKKHFEEKYNNSNERTKLNNLRDLILFNILLFSGQRIGDILKLKVKDAKSETIYFQQEKTGQEVTVRNPCLSQIVLYCEFRKLNNDDFLFCIGIDKKQMNYMTALSIIKESGFRVINKKISPHCFRAYVITELVLAGKSNAEIQTVSGHANSNMIDYYTTQKPQIDNLLELII